MRRRIRKTAFACTLTMRYSHFAAMHRHPAGREADHDRPPPLVVPIPLFAARFIDRARPLATFIRSPRHVVLVVSI